MVKGLAKLRNRLRHDRVVKYVDASPFTGEGRLLPNDGADYTQESIMRPSVRMLPELPSMS
jgi:hypothetical protein